MFAALPRRAWALAISVIALAAAAPAQAHLVHTGAGRFLGLVPREAPVARAIHASADTSASAAAPSSSGSGTLDYHNGPVVHASAPYLIFWDPAGEITASSRAVLERYLADSAADSGKATNIWAVDRQFTDSTGFADYRQTFTQAQAINDTQPLPGRDATNCPNVAATYPNCVTDSQITAEVSRVVAQDNLPLSSGAGQSIFLVVTPPDTNVCSDSADCASNTFCAYHSSFWSNNASVLYAAIPMFFSGASSTQNPKDCQSDGNSQLQTPNGDLADVAIKFLSHELSETITDPLGTGWYNTASGNEDGDNCNYWGASANPVQGSSPVAFGPALGGSVAAGTLFDQTISGDHYYTQTEWSNSGSGCEAQPAAGSIQGAISAPSGVKVGQAITLDPSSTTSTLGFTSATWDFGDGTPTTFSRTQTAPAAVQHTYAHAGTYTAAISVVDGDGNLSRITRQVIVANAPVAAFSVAPAQPLAGQAVTLDGTASFDPNGSITSYSWSFGDGSAPVAGASASHTFAAAGTYTVTLTIQDGSGSSASATRQVTVATPPPPVAVPVSTPPVTTPTVTTPPLTTPPVTTPVITPPVTVKPTPVAVFAYQARPVAGVRIRFDGTASHEAQGRIVAWRWYFGDGATATGPMPLHSFRRAGTYVVTLVVTDALGNRALVSGKVRVASALARVSRATPHKRQTRRAVRKRR